jgi:hypothetical protein
LIGWEYFVDPKSRILNGIGAFNLLKVRRSTVRRFLFIYLTSVV